jgi:NAD(P)-dependent dehydrogenase (short-subunit alcohol dehydrogenase family)
MPTALITGAGSGIGRAIALELSGAGYACALVGRGERALRETGGMLASPWCAICADLCDAGEASRIVDACVAQLGSLHALINNAGWSPSAELGATREEDIAQVFALNATAPAVSTQRAWGVFARQRAAGDAARMCVVSISSLATIDPFPSLWAYAGAKASVNVLTHSVASQGAKLGIMGFAVAPGAVETPLLRSIVPEAALPIEATLAPEVVASLVRACVVGERDADNGATLFVDKALGQWVRRLR